MLSLPIINKVKLSECEKPITDNKCEEAVFQPANDKSPSLDSFPLNFIKLSGLKLRVYLWNALIFFKLTNKLSDSQYEGILTLLPKPEKDKLFASNYRPIMIGKIY